MNLLFLIFSALTFFCATGSGKGFQPISNTDTIPVFAEKIDLNSKNYIRVVDGFITPDTLFFNSLKINSIRKIGDSQKLHELGLKVRSKPFMFICSDPGPKREYLNRLAGIEYWKQEYIVLIILNNELITPNKYYKIEELETDKVVKAVYDQNDTTWDFKIKMPLGAIKVQTETK